MTRPLLKSASALALLCILPVQAWAAADAQALADALKRQFDKNGTALTIGSATAEGDDVILSDVSIKPGEANAAQMEEIRLEDVSESETGFRIGTIAAPEFSMTKDGKTLDFGGASITGLQVPKENETDPVRKLSVLVEGATMGPVRVSEGDATIFSMDGIDYTASAYVAGEPLLTEMKVTGLQGDMTKLPDEKSRAVMQALGYSTLSGDMTMKGSWNPADGRMQINEWMLDVTDAAALNITMDLSGFTTDLIRQMQEITAKRDSGEMNEQAMGFAMMGLMQQLSFNGAQIALDDASLTGRVLDFVAAQQGARRADVVNMAKGMMPILLSRLQNPAFASMVAGAVSDYLDDPQSLTVTAAPAAPVPAPQIMGAAMGAPQTIPDVLNVTVEANTCGTITC